MNPIFALIQTPTIVAAPPPEIQLAIITGVFGIIGTILTLITLDARARVDNQKKMLDTIIERSEEDRGKLKEYEERDERRQKQFEQLSREFQKFRETAAENKKQMDERFLEFAEKAQERERALTGQVTSERQEKENALLLIGQLQQQITEQQTVIDARDAAIITLDERWVADGEKHEGEKRVLRQERDTALARIQDLLAEIEVNKTRIHELETAPPPLVDSKPEPVDPPTPPTGTLPPESSPPDAS